MSTRRIALKALLGSDQERKYNDVELTEDAAPLSLTSGTPIKMLLNGISRGNNSIARVGDSIRMRSLAINVRFVNVETNFELPVTIKWRLFIDKMPNQELPTDETLFQNPLNGETVMISANDLDYNQRYKTLKKGTYTVLSNQLQKYFSIFLRLRGRTSHVRYLDASSDVEGITANSLWLFFYTDATGNQSPGVTVFSRLRYVG